MRKGGPGGGGWGRGFLESKQAHPTPILQQRFFSGHCNLVHDVTSPPRFRLLLVYVDVGDHWKVLCQGLQCVTDMVVDNPWGAFAFSLITIALAQLVVSSGGQSSGELLIGYVTTTGKNTFVFLVKPTGTDAEKYSGTHGHPNSRSPPAFPSPSSLCSPAQSCAL